MSFRRLRRVRSVSRENCAWSCGAPALPGRWEVHVITALRLGGGVGMFKGCNGRVCDTRSLQSRDGLLPGFVCRLGCLLNIHRLCLLVAVECAEIGGGGGLDDLRETRLQDLLREKACPNCVTDRTLDARFEVCRSSDVPRSFEPNSRLACAEGCLCHAVLCETREEPFKRPLPDLVVDFCSPLFLQDCVAVNPPDVVGTANSQTLSEEGELRLRVLAELDAFVHCSDDICLAQELVRDEVQRPNSDSECDGTGGTC